MISTAINASLWPTDRGMNRAAYNYIRWANHDYFTYGGGAKPRPRPSTVDLVELARNQRWFELRVRLRRAR